jgi:hypothetical protein
VIQTDVIAALAAQVEEAHKIKAHVAQGTAKTVKPQETRDKAEAADSGAHAVVARADPSHQHRWCRST